MLIMYGCAAGVARDVEISVQQVLVGADVSYTFIHRSKIVVQEMYGLVHISDFKSSKCVKF